MLLHSRRVVTPAGTVSATVSVADGRVVEVGPGEAGAALDLGDRWLVPGLIDTHVHGGGGAQCNTLDPDEVARVARFHAAHGTTSLLATTVAASFSDLEGAVRAASGAGRRGEGAHVLGVHLEGPFLSPRWPGAMDPAWFVLPDPGVVSEGVRMMTVAPELPGSVELISGIAARGVAVSLGHSDASYAEAEAAVGAGARSVTHLFNAMAPFHHRAPGLVGAALDLPELQCELICDGVHVDPVALRLALHAKGVGGLRLVTDAMAAAGMGDGDYRLGGALVRVVGDRATVAGDKTIAGSVLTMDAALAGAVRWLGVTVEEAVAMASTNPAALLGLQDRKGAIAVGYDADLTVLDDELRACGTIVGGRWVSEPPVAAGRPR
jgi:N-acetylglucosamine-6-phosphate deacetylase